MASKEQSASSPSPYEIIFSCSVCQATISEIYAETESARGIRDGRSPHDRIVTKLWLTECAHLTCVKHLEGRGVPFYPEGEQPRAPCPLCVTEKDDKRLKRLYAIRGCHEGEYDEQIPGAWFDTPPIKLDGSGPGMEALRFQYLQLIRYGTEISLKQQQGKQLLDESQENLAVFQRSHDAMENRIKDMKAEIMKLQEKEAELKRFKEKEPAIRHYLGVVTDLAKENDLLKEQLTILGYAVPNTNYAYANEKNPVHTIPAEKATNGTNIKDIQVPNSPLRPRREHNRDMQLTRGGYPEKFPSSHTMGSSTNPRRGIDCKAAVRDRRESPPRKKRVISEFVDDRRADRSNDALTIRVDSRDLMPPPRLPLTRLSHESLGRPIANSGMSESLHQCSQNAPDLQVCEDGNWKSLRHSSRSKKTQIYSQAQLKGGTAQQARSPILETHKAPITLSKSPSKHRELPASSSHQVHMPFLQRLDEPNRAGQDYGYLPNAQYDRLQSFNQHHHRDSPSFLVNDKPIYEEETRILQPDFSLPVTCQPPTRPLPRGYDFVSPEEYQRTPFPTLVHGGDRNIFSPKMLAPGHTNNASHQESVLSPFFKSSQRNDHAFTRAREPLRGWQSTHRAFPESLQGYKTAPTFSSWAEPRNFNGLSFCNSPQDTMKESIYRSRNPRIVRSRPSRLSLTYSSPRNEQGIFLKRNNSQSFMQNEICSTLSRQSYPQQAAPLPSSMPSSVFNDRLLRSSKSFSNDIALAEMGVKGGAVRGASYNRTAGGNPDHNLPWRGLFSSSGGRRSVRR